MLFEYLVHIDNLSFFEGVIQTVLLYNAVQILKQNNFYYILAYFLSFILFLGLYLIIFDLDIVCIILWILYGGVVIIFFVYSLLWFDNIKNNKYLSKFRFIYYFLSIVAFVFFMISYTMLDIGMSFKDFINSHWTEFYNFILGDINEELDNLGWGILYYATFFFLVLSYMLFLVCCTSIVIILNAKKLKYANISLYFAFCKKSLSLLSFSFYKYQNFYTQDYENINQNHSVYKNFKITNKFHKVKNFNRRI